MKYGLKYNKNNGSFENLAQFPNDTLQEGYDEIDLETFNKHLEKVMTTRAFLKFNGKELVVNTKAMDESADRIKLRIEQSKEKELVDLHLEIKAREELGLSTAEKKEKLDYLKEIKNNQVS